MAITALWVIVLHLGHFPAKTIPTEGVIIIIFRRIRMNEGTNLLKVDEGQLPIQLLGDEYICTHIPCRMLYYALEPNLR